MKKLLLIVLIVLISIPQAQARKEWEHGGDHPKFKWLLCEVVPVAPEKWCHRWWNRK